MANGHSHSLHARFAACAVSVLALAATPALSENEALPGFNLYGSPGLVDMPTADMAPDANLAVTVSRFGDTTRTTLNFQITPRLSGSFRYAAINNFRPIGYRYPDYYDRSFDLRYQLLTEGNIRPAVTVGLQDFIGTGLYGGEYIVATKTLAPGLKVTGGVGWGRFGSHNPFATTGTRPAQLLQQGGVPNYDRLFRGDVAAFGGISYAPNDRLRFKVEYSSDEYIDEQTIGTFKKNSPWNFGVDYTFRNGAQLSLYHLYGSEVGAQITLATNPRTAGMPGGVEQAPLPVAPRGPGDAADLGWTMDPNSGASAKASLRQLAENEGLTVEAVELTATRATVRVRNRRYNATPQAYGRMARAMTRTLPASVEEFVIVPMSSGMALSAITIRRSDLEALENEPATEILARTTFEDGFRRAPAPDAEFYPNLDWSIAPYLQLNVFDPDNPVSADFGIRAAGELEITPNISISGSVTKKISGNLGDVGRLDRSNLPRVRTDYARYSANGDPAIEYLTLDIYGRPARNLYSRFSIGYLEQMYAGASAELLWKPVDSRLAFGAELNYVQRRDFDQLFGLQDMITIDPVTGVRREIPNLNGHVSVYYDFGNGFHGQVDAGRYLAGDYGATVSLDREFANGWRVGAYATFTDATADEFGEGSFDKGLRFTIPLSTYIGTPTRNTNQVNIQSLARDGGARLDVRGRLYEQVRDYHEPDAVKSWGRFWR